jgi:hypothetical protein
MKGLAWISFVLAVIAGAGLAATSSGLVQIVVVIAALIWAGIDIAKDRTPNLQTVAVAVTLPSLIRGMNGTLAKKIGDGTEWVWSHSAGWLGEWSGTGPTFGAAVAAVTVSFIIARKTMPKSGMGR